MKEIETIIKRYEHNKAQGLKMALAVVVNVEESSYRRSGARMLITEDGNWVGGISGGCLEGDTRKKAMYSILNQVPTKVTYDTRDNDPNQIGVGLGCNGLIDVLITPISESEPNPISVLKDIVRRRQPSILVTNLRTGVTTDHTYEKHTDDTIARIANAVRADRKSKMIKDDDGYFVEFVPPKISLFLFGKNYDAIPLTTIAKALGWHITIVANPLKVSKQLYELSDKVVNVKDQLLGMDSNSIGLLMSHDYTTDKANLVKLQSYNLPYIGMLGPQKRKQKMLQELESNGIVINEKNLYGPMGLDTGATSPEEIAISIVAEVRAVFEDRVGGYLKHRSVSIHK